MFALSPSHNHHRQGLTIHAVYNLNRSVIPISSGSRASLRPSIGARQTLCFSMRFHLTTVACFGGRDTGKRASRSFSRGSTTECHVSRCLSSLAFLALKARTLPKERLLGKSFSIRVRILPSQAWSTHTLVGQACGSWTAPGFIAISRSLLTCVLAGLVPCSCPHIALSSTQSRSFLDSSSGA